MTKDEARLKIIELQKFIDTPEKPTANEWLEKFIQIPFDKVEVNIKNQIITYYRNGQWLFQKDLKNESLWCYYYEVWQFFEKEYGMNYKEIQALIKDVVGSAFNCRDATPLALRTSFIFG